MMHLSPGDVYIGHQAVDSVGQQGWPMSCQWDVTKGNIMGWQEAAMLPGCVEQESSHNERLVAELLLLKHAIPS
jgi:hypothetical protein